DAWTRQSRRLEIGRDLTTDCGQRAREVEEVVVLRRIASCGPRRVIAVLFAPARITAGRLQVPARIARDPDLRPCRRNREPSDASERRCIPHNTSIRLLIG